MNTIKKTVALGFLVESLLGCAHSPSWTQGYESQTYSYQVTWLNAPTKEFLPTGWRLDNYSWDKKWDIFVEKNHGIYTVNRAMDIDGDGEVADVEKADEPLYDLYFTNEKDNGVIWAKAHPVLFRNKNKELSALMDGYVDSLAGRGLYKQGSLFGISDIKTREFMTFVTEQKTIALDGHEAISVVIELAEVEKIKVDPSHRAAKVKVVFTYFDYHGKKHLREADAGWQEVTDTIPRRGFGSFFKKKALLVLGYANSSHRFDQHVGDFDGMVQRVKFPIPSDSPPAAPPASSSPPPSASAPGL